VFHVFVDIGEEPATFSEKRKVWMDGMDNKPQIDSVDIL
jgi:hypothetical protein